MAAGRGGARLLVVLVVVAAVAAGVVLLGNTVGRSYLERQLASAAQARAGLSSAPTVSIKDSLLVWSLLRRQADRIEVAAQQVPFTVAGVDTRPDITVVMTDVSLKDDSPVAGSLTADLTLSWADVSTLARIPLQKGTGDVVETTITKTFRGIPVGAVITARPIIDSQGQLMLTEPQVKVNGVRLPEQATRSLANAALVPIDLQLPAGLKATKVSVGESGMVLSVSGDHVDLTQLHR